MGKILQLRISLKDFKPKIWRRFAVRNNINFNELHQIIQEVMGWENYHLCEFKVDELQIGLIDNDALDTNPDLKDAEKIKLSDYLKSEKQKFSYGFGELISETFK